MKDNHILILSGMSGSGKDSIAQLLKHNSGYNFTVSHTTRPMRDGESECKPYYFVTKEQFNSIEFIETREYDTLLNDIPDIWYYGVAKTAIDDNEKYVVVLDVEGTEEFIEYFGERTVPIYLYIDDDERKRRSISRGGHDESEWNRRLVDDKIVFSDKVVNRLYYAEFENENLERTYENIKKWVANKTKDLYQLSQ